jgi:hypothetical protein
MSLRRMKKRRENLRPVSQADWLFLQASGLRFVILMEMADDRAIWRLSIRIKRNIHFSVV